MALRDAIYGLAVGDALGVPFEFLERGSFACEGMVGYGTHRQPKGTWSDDTSMTLATCDSIRVCGRIDVRDMRARFERWHSDGSYTIDGLFDIGGTTARALEEGEGRKGEFDNGNGSLMRIAPLAYADAAEDEVGAVSAITHAHETSCRSCVEYVGALREIATGKMPELALRQRGIPRDAIRSGGYVRDTLDAALWCLANTASYRECVLAAVNLGEDTDTTAAVAGALAGELYGFDAIPEEWVRDLRGKDIIESCLF